MRICRDDEGGFGFLKKYIEKSKAIDEIEDVAISMSMCASVEECNAMRFGRWLAALAVDGIEPVDAVPLDELEDIVYDAISILNSINSSGRLNYYDYSVLHKAISAILLDQTSEGE